MHLPCFQLLLPLFYSVENSCTAIASTDHLQNNPPAAPSLLKTVKSSAAVLFSAPDLEILDQGSICSIP